MEGRMGEPPSQRLNRAFTMGGLSELVDSEVVPSSLSSIAPILRVANEIEKESPRVAYLCRFYAFERAHKLDPTSSGRGVRQFKTALLQRLERDSEPTAQKKQRKTDTGEMHHFYEQYYDKYVKARDENPNQIDRAQLSRVYQTAYVLFQVLQNVTQSQSEIIDPKIMKAAEDVGKKKEIYIPYNILPLDPASKSQAIMQLPEIKVAVSILCNTRGLYWPQDNQSVRGTALDLLDWLEIMFGFQKDNVANQREHIILLLANLQIRLAKNAESETKLDEDVLNHVIKRLFKNYRNWCKFLGRENHLELPFTRPEIQKRKILHVGLYLLIWGEAANVRFMPECLCYIFHHMVQELSGMLDARVSPVTGENIKPAYGGDRDSFLRKVITPIYRVIEKEAQACKNHTLDHSSWRNYDDLNEYFWSADCFKLGWPMRVDADFFTCLNVEKHNGDLSSTKKRRWAGKTSFVEVRSFWHIIRSFDRMWAFLILSLQAMIVVAWNGSGSPLAIFDRSVFQKVLSITITSAFLRLLQAILDIALNIRVFRSMRITDIIRYALKLIVAIAWAIVLPVSYLQTWDGLYDWLDNIKNWFSSIISPSFFYTAIIIYVSPNILGMLIFLFPILRRWTENSNWRIVEFLLWWSQPKLYTGRGMHESFFDLFKYTCFWILLLLSKFLFSFYIEVKPLINPTRQIMLLTINSYSWHELFPTGNFGVVLSLWAPVTLVYFMDIQIWYAVLSTVYGGFMGAFSHLGEIRTIDMLRSRFSLLPDAFNTNLVPSDKVSKRNSFANQKYEKPSNDKTVKFAKFALLWNEVIIALRNEDFINNSEMDLLLVPYPLDSIYGVVQWPPFLLASKILQALDMVNEFEGTRDDLKERLNQDEYMRDTVIECYRSLKHVLGVIAVGKNETEVIDTIFEKVEAGNTMEDFCQAFNMKALTVLYQKFTELVIILKEGNPKDQERVIFLLLDMYEVVTKDFIPEKQAESFQSNDPYLFQSRENIHFPPEKSDAWTKQIDRLHLLLTTEEDAINVPTNLQAQRRIAFFTNSLFMNMPRAPKVRKMLSFSVLTPYYEEEILYNKEKLESQNDDGISILFYLQRIYPDEWNNFLERIKCPADVDPLFENELAVRHWVSYRAQTLTRTVRGMMYYRRALELQVFLDTATDTDIRGGFNIVKDTLDDVKMSPDSLHAQLQAVVDMKFTYVVTCQKYGTDKRAGKPEANEIIALMNSYPSLRVAYIDEIEERVKDKTIKEYYSVLVKAAEKLNQEEAKLDQVIYKIKLPGNPNIGEGKPENQNHAIIFTRGETLQAIDMNQDNYLEEAFKMRNLLQEFLSYYGVRNPSILGVREHIFTGSVSSLAWFMSIQESCFVTIGQRVLANPLKVRFHYGHPDVFDRLFHIGIGGISKASKGINLSEDIFAGFNTTLRKGNVTHHEYIQVGKGRDVGLNQISLFEAKIANGNGEQTLSRDVYRLGHRFDFFRMLSFYFTTIGFYIGSLIVVLTVYVFLYGRLYLALSGLEKKVAEQANLQINEPLQAALASQSFVQLGLLMALPMVMELVLEQGFQCALSDFIVMQLQLASVFFTFSLGTKVHYYGRTILHGGSKYRATGRGFVVFHEKFAENYRLYSRTHFIKGSELMILLIIYQIYGDSYASTAASLLVNIFLWFMVGTWLYAPFFFNPLGFEWQKIMDDWDDWNKWIKNKGSVGVPSNKSWESWWNEEMYYLKFSGFCGRMIEVFMSLRFFLYQYGLVYHLHIARGNKSIWVYAISWLVLLIVLMFLKIISVGRRNFRAEYQLLFRLVKGCVLIGCLAVLIALFTVGGLTIGDLFVCFLAFLPSGWALLQIAQACKPLVKCIGVWDSVKALARGYEYLMGLLLFFPVVVLAWFPLVSEFQTRLLFNQAFSRGLQISRILVGGKK